MVKALSWKSRDLGSSPSQCSPFPAIRNCSRENNYLFKIYKVSSYLAIVESVVLKEKYRNLLELMNVCIPVYLLVKCPRTGLKGKNILSFIEIRG